MTEEEVDAMLKHSIATGHAIPAVEDSVKYRDRLSMVYPPITQIVVPDRYFALYTCDQLRASAKRLGLKRIRAANGLFVVTVP